MDFLYIHKMKLCTNSTGFKLRVSDIVTLDTVPKVLCCLKEWRGCDNKVVIAERENLIVKGVSSNTATLWPHPCHFHLEGMAKGKVLIKQQNIFNKMSCLFFKKPIP